MNYYYYKIENSYVNSIWKWFFFLALLFKKFMSTLLFIETGGLRNIIHTICLADPIDETIFWELETVLFYGGGEKKCEIYVYLFIQFGIKVTEFRFNCRLNWSFKQKKKTKKKIIKFALYNNAIVAQTKINLIKPISWANFLQSN